MQDANATLRERWASGQHVGLYAPRQVVKIQRGVMDHAYMEFPGGVDFGYIAGSEHNALPWQAFWRATGDWLDVPNVDEVTLEQSFDNNGVTTATIRIANIVYKALVGVLGTYHAIMRGYMSPWLGYHAFGRPNTADTENEWLDALNGGYRVKVWQGYGDKLKPTFVGLIDETQVTVGPDEIVLTSRDFGELLTDQKMFGWNKAAEVRPPIVFADKNRATNVHARGGVGRASSHRPGHPAANVTRDDTSTWMSEGRSAADVTEWVQITVPAGTYRSFSLDPAVPMEMWVSIIDGASGEYVDPAVPLGLVPGADNGGYPFVYHRFVDKGGAHDLGDLYELGDGSIFRFAFRGLKKNRRTGLYHAAVRRAIAYETDIHKEALKNHWVLVDDAADAVKWVLMWAGFKDWDVESLGARIGNSDTDTLTMPFGQTNMMIDVIEQFAAQGSYQFYMGPPTESDDSLGIPTFRRIRALDGPGGDMIELTDDTVLTNVEPQWSKESLPYVIYARGRQVGKGQGVTLGQDDMRRPTAQYFPPWSGAHHNLATGVYDAAGVDRLAGLRKHLVHTDANLEDENDCMMAAILMAVQGMLAAYTASIECPGLPDLTLDQQVSLISGVAGLNSRLWIASITSTFHANAGEGGDPVYAMTLQGSLLDTPDMDQLTLDYLTQLAVVAAKRSQWGVTQPSWATDAVTGSFQREWVGVA